MRSGEEDLIGDPWQLKVHHAIVNHAIVASRGMERACQSNLSIGHDMSTLLSSAIHVDVQHRELHKIGDWCERIERHSPVDWGWNVAYLQGLRIEELYGVAHASADGEWAGIA